MIFKIALFYMFVYLAYTIFNWSLLELIAFVGAVIYAYIVTSDK